jgi:Cof subfamily protein (haloacid dehalogenase superfamily)
MSAVEPLRLLVSDVDGTLVTREKRLTPGVIAAIRGLKAAGVGFTLISARPPSGLLRLAETLEINLPMAAFNGATLFRRDGLVVERYTVNERAARGLLALIGRSPPDLWVFAGGQWWAENGDNPHLERECLASDQPPVFTHDLSPLLDQADKLTWVSDDHEQLAHLAALAQQAFGSHVTIARSQPYYLDVTAPEGNKGAGVAALARLAGVDLPSVAAIGDTQNDVAMFAKAGLSIAMGQASQELRANAACVTTSNEEDGVARAIERFILPRHAV